MPSDTDNVARAIAIVSAGIAAASLYTSRRDIKHRGTRTKIELRRYVGGMWEAIVTNPTDLPVPVQVTVAGINSRWRRVAAFVFGWAHPVAPPGVEWRQLSKVISSYGGILLGSDGRERADDWVTIGAKDRAIWGFSLVREWRPMYLAVVVENGVGGKRRSRFIRSSQ